MRKTFTLVSFIAMSASAQSIPSGSIVLGGTSVNTAIAAAQHQAGAISPLDYGVVCSGTSTATALAASVSQYAAAAAANPGSYLADAQLQIALTAAGNYATTFIGPTLEGLSTDLGNMPQGVVRFPQGQLCASSNGLSVPIGVHVAGNHSVLMTVAPSSYGLRFLDTIPGMTFNGGGSFPNNKYGRNFDSVDDLVLVGPGSTISTGNGLTFNVGVGVNVSGVFVFGFHHGLELQETEYSSFFGFYAAHNNKGLVCGQANQKSLQDNFFGGAIERNDSENVWAPSCSAVKFYGTSLSFAGDIPVVVGPQPTPYVSLKGYKVTSPGSGCTATVNATSLQGPVMLTPLTITDKGGTGSAEPPA